MGIVRDRLKQQIEENNRQQSNDTTATIIEYNMVLNTAKIRYLNPNGEGFLYRDNVSIANTLGGLTGAGIYPGQTCAITFIKNNIYNPIITGLTSNNYALKTCTDQGAYIIDSGILSIEKPGSITSMTSNWLEEENVNYGKYINDLGDYSQIDSSEVIHEVLSTLDKYKEAEQGITNLSTKSTIKLKENGDIDIFVANSVGIRISPETKTVSLYGTLQVNNQTIDLSKIINDTTNKE